MTILSSRQERYISNETLSEKLLFCLAEMQEIDCYLITKQMAGMCVAEVDAVVTDVVIGIAIMEWNAMRSRIHVTENTQSISSISRIRSQIWDQRDV